MICHVVLWRIKPEARLAGQIKGIAAIRQAVEALQAGMPGLEHIELAVNEASGADAADLMLQAHFSSWDALAVYEQHPLHGRLRELIGPIRSERRVVDYER